MKAFKDQLLNVILVGKAILSRFFWNLNLLIDVRCINSSQDFEATLCLTFIYFFVKGRDNSCLVCYLRLLIRTNSDRVLLVVSESPL